MRIYKIMQLGPGRYTKMPKDKDHSGKMDTQLFPEVPGWPDFQHRRKRKKGKPRKKASMSLTAQALSWENHIKAYVNNFLNLLKASKDSLGIESADMASYSHPHYEISCDCGKWKINFFFNMGENGDVRFDADVTGQITEEAKAVNALVLSTFHYVVSVASLNWDNSYLKEFLEDWAGIQEERGQDLLMDEIADSLIGGQD